MLDTTPKKCPSIIKKKTSALSFGPQEVTASPKQEEFKEMHCLG